LGNDEIERACESPEVRIQFGIGKDMSRVLDVESAPELQMALIRILIVDDFDLWKGFVIARLQERPDLRIVGFASDGLQAVEKAKELQPDLILLDMMLPKLNGIEAARQIREVAPQAKILFVSSESDLESVQMAFQVGGSGYVSKMEAAAGLLAGIDAVLRGERFISPGLADSGDASSAPTSNSEGDETAT
jgi:two-component system, NarL family, nitrate/nitrite response regulator NarL